MTVDPFKLLEEWDYITPRPEVQEQLNNAGSLRMFHLSKLKGPKGFCVWCGKGLTGRQQRWCGQGCVDSALMVAFPQGPAQKLYRLVKVQNCMCPYCGQDFTEKIKERILEIFNRWNKRNKPGDQPKLVLWVWLGDNTGDIWQTDHIVPIFKGGKGIDPKNLQTICTECHRHKTARER